MSASTEPLASAAPTTESIYTGIVPVVLKHADREDRATTLTVALAYGVAQPRNQKVLHVQLTDEHGNNGECPRRSYDPCAHALPAPLPRRRVASMRCPPCA